MNNLATQFYLASASPRRAELLSQMGYRFECLSVDVDESVIADESPIEFVKRLALTKVLAGVEQAAERPLPVIGADTAIYCDGDILCKPDNRQDAARMLEMLSDNTHKVYTAVAICTSGENHVLLNESEVTMRPITSDEIAQYWKTGEPCDKAAGYAIQGLAAAFIMNIRGSYSGIMGLPLFETVELLKKYHIASPLQNGLSEAEFNK